MRRYEPEYGEKAGNMALMTVSREICMLGRNLYVRLVRMLKELAHLEYPRRFLNDPP